MRKKIQDIQKDKEFLLIETTDTNFYPGGGGQPCDHGFIENEDFKGEVVEVFKQEGKIIHKVKPIKGKINEEDPVELVIDQDRRNKLTRMHSAEHVLFKSIEKQFKYPDDFKLEKINLDTDESSIFVIATKLNWDILFKAEELANKIISDDKRIQAKEYSKTEAENVKDLRIKLDRIKSDKIRITHIDGFDNSACTGTHVSSTKEIGNILITAFNINRGNYEIRFKVDVNEDLMKLSQIARQSSSILETDIDSVPNLLKKLIKERDDYKKKFRELQKSLPVELNSEKINDIEFKFKHFEKFDRKKLMDVLKENLEEKSVVCLVNSKEEKANVILACSKDLDIDIPVMLKTVLDKFGGRGGGRDKIAQGSVGIEFKKQIIKEIMLNLN